MTKEKGNRYTGEVNYYEPHQKKGFIILDDNVYHRKNLARVRITGIM